MAERQEFEPVRWRLKPVTFEVEAMVVPPEGDMTRTGHLVGWLFMVHHADAMVCDGGCFEIQTAQGTVTAEPGNVIVRLPEGDFIVYDNEDAMARKYERLN